MYSSSGISVIFTFHPFRSRTGAHPGFAVNAKPACLDSVLRCQALPDSSEDHVYRHVPSAETTISHRLSTEAQVIPDPVVRERFLRTAALYLARRRELPDSEADPGPRS